MPKKRRTWRSESVGRSDLALRDADPGIRHISTGALPGWMRRAWIKKGGLRAFQWIAWEALPPLYTKRGERLARDAGVALVRTLSKTKAAQAHPDVELWRSYLHPVATARFVEQLALLWMDNPGSGLERMARAWAIQSHRLFLDRHSIERLTGALFQRTSLHSEERVRLVLKSFRAHPEAGEAMLRLLEFCLHEPICTTARMMLGDERPYPRWWRPSPETEVSLEVLSLEEQHAIIETLGLVDGERVFGERWVGFEFFESVERLAGGDEDTSLQITASLLEILYPQTRRSFEESLGKRWTWDRWHSLFLTRPYFSFWAQRVLWQREDGEVFRVCEDLSYADVNEDEVEVLGAITLARCDGLGEDRGAWVELFADYEIAHAVDGFFDA